MTTIEASEFLEQVAIRDLDFARNAANVGRDPSAYQQSAEKLLECRRLLQDSVPRIVELAPPVTSLRR